MTRKHFKAIAEIIAFKRSRWAGDAEAVSAIDDTAEELATYLVGTNPNFNRARFLAACSGRGGAETTREDK
jgi:hypothetical protein